MDTEKREEVFKEFEKWLNDKKDTVKYSKEDSTFTVRGTKAVVSKPMVFYERFYSLPILRIKYIKLTERDLEVYQYFLLEFISLEIFPDEIRNIPENSKEELGKFWLKLIANRDCVNQFFASIRSFYVDPLIPELQNIVEEIRDKFSEKLPESKINNLESAVKEICIPHPQPSIEEIMAAIKKAETETLPLDNQENISLFSEIKCLSEEAKDWLRKLFIHLVKNPKLETYDSDIYDLETYDLDKCVNGIISAMNQLLFHCKKISDIKSSG